MKQQLELADPTVARFAVECGVVEIRTSIRLQSKSRAALDLQIEQLQRTFGAALRMREPHPSGNGGWIVFGSIGR